MKIIIRLLLALSWGLIFPLLIIEVVFSPIRWLLIGEWFYEVPIIIMFIEYLQIKLKTK